MNRKLNSPKTNSANFLLEWKDFYNLMLWSPYTPRRIDEMPARWRMHLRKLEDTPEKIEELFISLCYSAPQTDPVRERFEKCVKDSEVNPFYVTGYAGVGKSTYINATLVRICGELNSIGRISKKILLDIARDDRAIPPEISDKWREWEQNKKTKIYLFVGALLHEINKSVFKFDEESEEVFKERLRKIVTNYKELYFANNHKMFNAIFVLMEEYYAQEIPYTYDSVDIKNAEKNEKKSYLYRMKESLWKECCGNPNLQPPVTFEMLLQLLVMFQTCELYTAESDFRVIITIDNVEHFIGDVQLYDVDLVEILENFDAFPKRLDGQWRNIRQLKQNGAAAFSSHFALMMVMREVTSGTLTGSKMLAESKMRTEKERLAGLLRDHLADINYINITESFDAGDIIRRKFDFIRKYISEYFSDIADFINENNLDCIDEDGKRTGLFEAVFSDSELYKALQSTYSHNKRRIVKSFLAAFSCRSSDIDAYLYFNNIADELECEIDELLDRMKKFLLQTKSNANLSAFEMAKKKSNIAKAQYSIYRHGARQIIYRSLLDQIETSNFLKDVGKLDLKNSVARRVLTYLLNAGNCSFRDLLWGVFESPTRAKIPTKDDAKILAEVLYTMKDQNPDNFWCPLVLVTFNDYLGKYPVDPHGNPTVESLNNLFISLLGKAEKENSYEDDDKTFSIAITLAGARCVHSIITSFEYYAARYRREYPNKERSLPLFTEFYKLFAEEDVISKSSLEKWTEKIIRHIGNVASSTFKRMDKVAETDRDFVFVANGVYHFNRLYAQNSERKKYLIDERPHPQRVMDTHIQYIDDFRRLVLIEAMKRNILNDPKLEPLVGNFSKSVLSVIQKYIRKLEHFAADPQFVSGEPRTQPASKHYYFGGYDRAQKIGSTDIQIADAFTKGKNYYLPFQANLNTTEKDLLNWENEVGKND